MVAKDFINVSPEHSKKAMPPIDITPSGIVIYDMLLHREKTLLSIDVTVDGITVFLQPYKSLFADVSIIALQLFLLS